MLGDTRGSTMNNEENVRVIEVTEKQAKKAIDMQDCLNELSTNSKFIKLILKGYCEDEAVRLVLLKKDPNMLSAENQANIDSAIDSISQLHQYFLKVKIVGDMAKATLHECDLVREELSKEDDGE
jgi:hypothetical protein